MAKLSYEQEEKILKAAFQIMERRVERDSYVKTPKTVIQYLQIKLTNIDHETFGVIYLDQAHGIMGFEELFNGTVNCSSVYPRTVAQQVLKKNAAAVVFYHQHPSGCSAEPSKQDLDITNRLKDVLKMVDCRVLDHFIVSGTKHYSFKEQGLL